MNKRKIEYITIKSKEYKAIKIIIGILIATNIFLCFKGMALMRQNTELLHEKQVLEEIMEAQKEQLEGI